MMEMLYDRRWFVQKCDRHHFVADFYRELYKSDARIVVWVLGSVATKIWTIFIYLQFSEIFVLVKIGIFGLDWMCLPLILVA